MKKSIVAVALASMLSLLAVAAPKDEFPVFTGEHAENAVVLGTKGLTWWNMAKGLSVIYWNLNVMNKTTEYNIPLKIYKMKKAGGKWEELGDITLGAPCEISEFDDSKFGKGEKDYKFYAVVPQNGKSYNITITDDYANYFAYSRRYLFINVAPLDPDADMSYKKNAKIINVADVEASSNGAKFKDNINIVNKTSDETVALRLYGFSDQYPSQKKAIVQFKWQYYGAGDDGADKIKASQRIWVYGDNVKSEAWNPVSFVKAGRDVAEAKVYAFNAYSYKQYIGTAKLYKNIAVVFEGGKSYSMKTYIQDDDLFIELTD